MTQPTLEQISVALWALAPAISWDTPPRTWALMSRRLLHWDDVPDVQQPAIFQVQHDPEFHHQRGLPYRVTLDFKWVIYQCLAKDPSAVPAIENNLIMQAIMGVIPDPLEPTEVQTLGGLVHSVYIDGVAFQDAGELDNQGIIVVPIKVLVA